MSKLKSGSGRGSLWVAFTIFSGLILFYFFGLRSCVSSNEYALEQLIACPEAVERLGEPVERGWWPGYGSYESLGGMERTSWALPVKGSKEKGILKYNYSDGAGSTGFSGHLEVGDEVVNVGLCTVQGEMSPVCQEAHTACLQVAHPDVQANCENLRNLSEEICQQLLPAYQLGVDQESAAETSSEDPTSDDGSP